MLKKAILPLALMMVSGAASAGVVTNDTALLSGSDHAQLSEWLGSDFDLTRIFAKEDGDNSQDWHVAVDGQGATFTVMELFDNDTNERRVIGGYNSNSWSSVQSWTQSETNFLFNLTDSLIFDVASTGGGNAALNHPTNASTFGAGYDLVVYDNLTNGYSNIGSTYGNRGELTHNSYRETFAGSFNNWTIGAYETYTLSASTGDFGTGAIADVPVSFLLGGLSLLGIAAARRKQRA